MKWIKRLSHQQKMKLLIWSPLKGIAEGGMIGVFILLAASFEGANSTSTAIMTGVFYGATKLHMAAWEETLEEALS